MLPSVGADSDAREACDIPGSADCEAAEGVNGRLPDSTKNLGTPSVSLTADSSLREGARPCLPLWGRCPSSHTGAERVHQTHKQLTFT